MQGSREGERERERERKNRITDHVNVDRDLRKLYMTGVNIQ